MSLRTCRHHSSQHYERMLEEAELSGKLTSHAAERRTDRGEPVAS
jgi:hypothetical protein